MLKIISLNSFNLNSMDYLCGYKMNIRIIKYNSPE